MNRRAGLLARAIGERLTAAGWRIGLVETLTGGAVSDRLTDVAGSSAYFVGAINPRTVETLRGWLPDRPSDPRDDPVFDRLLARQVADWIRGELGAEVGLAIVGRVSAGAAASVATVQIAVRPPEQPIVTQRRFRGTVPEIQARTAQAALRLVHTSLERLEAIPSPR